MLGSSRGGPHATDMRSCRSGNPGFSWELQSKDSYDLRAVSEILPSLDFGSSPTPAACPAFIRLNMYQSFLKPIRASMSI